MRWILGVNNRPPKLNKTGMRRITATGYKLLIKINQTTPWLRMWALTIVSLTGEASQYGSKIQGRGTYQLLI